jgi:hypothetical protein
MDKEQIPEKITLPSMNKILVFKPRPSTGWLWLIGLALLVVGPIIGMILPSLNQVPLWPMGLVLALSLIWAGYFLLLAIWFPTMRYELADDLLTLRYGPVLCYRIPLHQIRSIRQRNLGLSLWSSLWLPGLVLFTAFYRDVGRVKMCATATLTHILLIETDQGLYGLTPADATTFMAAIRTRLEE